MRIDLVMDEGCPEFTENLRVSMNMIGWLPDLSNGLIHSFGLIRTFFLTPIKNHFERSKQALLCLSALLIL